MQFGFFSPHPCAGNGEKTDLGGLEDQLTCTLETNWQTPVVRFVLLRLCRSNNPTGSEMKRFKPCLQPARHFSRDASRCYEPHPGRRRKRSAASFLPRPPTCCMPAGCASVHGWMFEVQHSCSPHLNETLCLKRCDKKSKTRIFMIIKRLHLELRI